MGMSYERSLEEFRAQLALKLPGTEIVHFTSRSEPCRVRHLECGAEYEFKPSTLRDRRGCPVCSSSSKARTHEEVRAKVRHLTGGQYDLLPEPRWESAAQPVRFAHSCGNVFTCSSRSMLNAIKENLLPCRVCNGKELITEGRFRGALSDAGDYVLLGEVVNLNTPTLVRHETCGTEWSVRPGNFLHRKTRCPKCSNPRGSSKGARAVAAALQRLGIQFVEEARLLKNSRTGRYLPLDFFLPSLAAAIEYDGSQHDPDGKPFPERPYSRIQELDDLKTRLCAASNIHLLRLHHSCGHGKVVEERVAQFIRDVVQHSDMVISSEATSTEWNVQRLSKTRPSLGGSE